VEGARVESVLEAGTFATVALNAARVTGFGIVVFIVPGRIAAERETACGPDLGREVAEREGARVNPGSGFGAGLARENGLSSSDFTQRKSRSDRTLSKNSLPRWGRDNSAGAKNLSSESDAVNSVDVIYDGTSSIG